MPIEEYIAVSNRSELIAIVCGAVLNVMILVAGGKLGIAVLRAAGMKVVAMTLFLVAACIGYIAFFFFYDWLYHLQMDQAHDSDEFYCHNPSPVVGLVTMVVSVSGLIIFLRRGRGACSEI